jgi:hypothetical protein
VHIHTLLGQIRPAVTDLNVLAVQLTAALDGPLLLLLQSADLAGEAIRGNRQMLERGWTDLIALVCRS